MAWSISRESWWSSTSVSWLQKFFQGFEKHEPKLFTHNIRLHHQANTRKQNDDDGGKQYFKLVSRYNVKNAFLEQFMPLSNIVHGPFRMMLPESLHASGSRLIIYSRLHWSGTNCSIQCYSETKWVWSSTWIDAQWSHWWHKNQSSKQKGNLFLFLCIAHRIKAKTILKNSLQLSDVIWRKCIHFLKSYLPWRNGFMTALTKTKYAILGMK